MLETERGPSLAVLWRRAGHSSDAMAIWIQFVRREIRLLDYIEASDAAHVLR
jgi:hypothetical protein